MAVTSPLVIATARIARMNTKLPSDVEGLPVSVVEFEAEADVEPVFVESAGD